MTLATRRPSKPFLGLLLLVTSVAIVGLMVMASANTKNVARLETLLSASANVPQTEQQKTIQFAAVGDFDYNDQTFAVFDSLSKQNTDFTLGLGDLSYGKTPDEQTWCDMVQGKLGATYPFQLVAGNHDVTPSASGGVLDRFAACLPNRMSNAVGVYPHQYYFDYSIMARFIVISPDLIINGKSYEYTTGTSEYDWLVDAIDSARKQSIRWVVVAMHKNCITVGEKLCEITPQVLDVLASKKVDLLLQGHEHGYMRSHQLRLTDQCPSLLPGGFVDSCVHTNADARYAKGDGPILAIVGTGGAPLRPIRQDSSDTGYFASFSGSNISPAFGSLIVSIDMDQLGAQFIDTNGAILDSFSIR